MSWPFVPGKHYNRRADIHGEYGGQQQGGIATPANHPVIFIFTGRGDRHGYADTWLEDGTLRYCGEGQIGDMRMTAGNRALRDHAADGKDVLLFEKLGSGRPVEFIGQFVVASWTYESQPDKRGNPRQAIIFDLTPIESVQDFSSANQRSPNSASSLIQLRKRALDAAQVPSSGKRASRTILERSSAVRDYVLARAGHICEACGGKAPFTTKAGQPYLEPHHIRRLSDGGPDHPSYVAGICPNCHRRAHYGADAGPFNAQLLERISQIEQAMKKEK